MSSGRTRIAGRVKPLPRLNAQIQGFTYIGVLLAMALVGVGLMAASEVWVTTAQRQKIVQLEWAGQQYEQAIASYYHASPGPVKQHPATLNELLDDHRVAVQRRHLRVLYPNPFSGQVDWQPVVAADGGMQGVEVSVIEGARTTLRRFVAAE